jgi:16S rRNA G966 N2-methylase RsmD
VPEHQKNALYYGDNLAVLREYIPDASVDLIYLDPPFNSRQGAFRRTTFAQLRVQFCGNFVQNW